MEKPLIKKQDYLIQKKNETRSMRSKEDAHDYRYFPDPDLLPLEVSDKFIDNIDLKYLSYRMKRRKDLLKSLNLHHTKQQHWFPI